MAVFDVINDYCYKKVLSTTLLTPSLTSPPFPSPIPPPCPHPLPHPRLASINEGLSVN